MPPSDRSHVPPAAGNRAGAERAHNEHTRDEHAPPDAPEGWRGVLLHDSLLVSGVAVCVLLGTYALLGLAPDGPLLVLAFCGTYVVYQADRTLGFSPEDAINRPGRVAWVRQHRAYIRAATIGAVVVGLGMLPWLRPATLAVGAGLGALAGLHVWPVLPQGRLKALGITKSVSICGVWALGGVLLPVVEAGAPVTGPVWGLVAYRFLFFWPNTLLMDWGDRVGDAALGLRTAATAWTERRVRGLASCVLGLALMGIVVTQLVAPWPLLALDAAGPLILLAAVWWTDPGQRPADALVLDLILAWPVVTYLVHTTGGMERVLG